MMRKEDRLRSLEMCVARHDRVEVFLSLEQQNALKLENELLHLSDCTAKMQSFIQRNLIVPAAPRVKFPSHGADFLDKPLFNRHVNIFLLPRKLEFPRVNLFCDGPQGGSNAARFLQ